MGNLFKAITTVITTACAVLVKLLSSAERGANALDELAQAGEQKAKNFKELVKLNDEAEFETRKAEINAARVTAGLAPKDIQSTQQKEIEEKAAKDKQIADAKAKATKEAEDDLDI